MADVEKCLNCGLKLLVPAAGNTPITLDNWKCDNCQFIHDKGKLFYNVLLNVNDIWIYSYAADITTVLYFDGTKEYYRGKMSKTEIANPVLVLLYKIIGIL